MKVSGNKILITGGASGIGLGLTKRFLKDGNTVIVCGRRIDILEELMHMHPAVITFQCDLATSEERERLYNWVTKNHPDLNVIVNNAGIFVDKSLIDLTEEDYERTLNINLKSGLLKS